MIGGGCRWWWCWLMIGGACRWWWCWLVVVVLVGWLVDIGSGMMLVVLGGNLELKLR